MARSRASHRRTSLTVREVVHSSQMAHHRVASMAVVARHAIMAAIVAADGAEVVAPRHAASRSQRDEDRPRIPAVRRRLGAGRARSSPPRRAARMFRQVRIGAQSSGV